MMLFFENRKCFLCEIMVVMPMILIAGCFEVHAHPLFRIPLGNSPDIESPSCPRDIKSSFEVSPLALTPAVVSVPMKFKAEKREYTFERDISPLCLDPSYLIPDANSRDRFSQLITQNFTPGMPTDTEVNSGELTISKSPLKRKRDDNKLIEIECDYLTPPLFALPSKRGRHLGGSKKIS